MHEDVKKLMEEGERFEAMARKVIAEHEAASGISLWERMSRLVQDVERLRGARSQLSQAAGQFPRRK